MIHHAIAGLLIGIAYFVGNSATVPEQVLAPNAEQMVMAQGQIPVEYKTNNLAIALAGILAIVGVIVEFAPSIQAVQKQWKQSQVDASVEILQAQLNAIQGQFVQPTAIAPLFNSEPVAEVAPAQVVPPQKSLREQRTDADTELQESWLIDFLFDRKGNPLHTNVAIQGPEGQGKTTLGEAIIALNSLGYSKIQAMRGEGKSLNEIVSAASGEVSNIEKLLINPKHIASKPTWSFPPFVSAIDDVLDGITHCYELMDKRVKDPGFDPDTANHRWFIVDEHDWNFEAHGKGYLGKVKAIAKVCREVKDHLLIMGQSALTGDTGLNGSDYLQMGRIVLWTEAIKLLGLNSFIFSGKDALKAKAEELFEASERFALVIPSKGGLPFIAKLPNLPGARRAKPKAPKNVVPIKASNQ